MEALAAARKSKASGGRDNGDDDGREKRKRRSEKGGADGGDENGEGYASDANSIDSAQFKRTQADDDFIDNDDEDPDAMKELYAEQNFDDEPDDNFVDDGKGGPGSSKSSKKKAKRKRDSADYISDNEDADGEPSNPILAAVRRMKKKKVVKKNQVEIEKLAIDFLEKMQLAVESDKRSLAERRPGTKKLAMLNEVCNFLAKTDMTKKLLDGDDRTSLLSVSKLWIEPLPNGQLGNITVRQRLLTAIGNMNGKDGIEPRHLKESGFGKVVMQLYTHKQETPEMKRQLKTLIEMWSRPIFKKSGNMRELSAVGRRGDGGIVGIARKNAAAAAAAAAASARAASSKSSNSNRSKGEGDLGSMLTNGMMKSRDIGNNRVRIPYSKGFQFSIRPKDKVESSGKDSRRKANMVKESREGLQKRMIEKNRPVGKSTNRSANVSIEGRPTT